MIRVDEVTSFTPELLAAVGGLVPQLTVKPPPSETELRALVESDCSTLVVARDDRDAICGMACVSVYRVPTGIRAVIEDVVVDSSLRGQGIGELLTRRCLNVARRKGVASVTLTSNPAREAANRLYLRMGFTLRETNSYIYRFA
ncbi:MAG: GNAT family N-acetyltransferase [Anaerolineae bacterium]